MAIQRKRRPSRPEHRLTSNAEGNVPQELGAVNPENPKNLAFGDALRALRKSHGFRTQEDFAAAVGVHGTTVSDWERGAQPPSPKHAAKIGEILGVDVERFSSGLSGAVRVMREASVPVLGTVAAGDPKSAGIVITREDRGELHFNEGTFALRVKGDSMSPVVWPGQHVLVDDVSPQPGDLVVCCLKGGGAIFRRFTLRTRGGTFVLEAVNPLHGDPVELDLDEIESCHRVRGAIYIDD